MAEWALGWLRNNLVYPIHNVLKKPLWLPTQSGIVIKYSVQSKFTNYHRSRNKNICQVVCKFGMIRKYKVCCVWDNVPDFGNFEESPCQGILFDIKAWTCYWKGPIYHNVLAINFFFHNLTCWRYEHFKHLVSHTQQ